MGKYGLKSKLLRNGEKVERYYTLDKSRIGKYIRAVDVSKIEDLDGGQTRLL